MTNQDWWQASDGKWYPPETRPSSLDEPRDELEAGPSSDAKSFCPGCGVELGHLDRFCSSCGRKVEFANEETRSVVTEKSARTKHEEAIQAAYDEAFAVTHEEAGERALMAERHAKLCGFIGWALLVPHLILAALFFDAAFESGRSGDDQRLSFAFGIGTLFTGALLYMTPMVFRHVLEMKATSLRLQVDEFLLRASAARDKNSTNTENE